MADNSTKAPQRALRRKTTSIHKRSKKNSKKKLPSLSSKTKSKLNKSKLNRSNIKKLTQNKSSNQKSIQHLHKNANRQRILVLGKYKLLANKYGSTHGFNTYLTQILCKTGEKGTQQRIPHQKMWHNAKVECLSYPIENLHDSIGDDAVGGAGHIGQQLLAGIESGWPYTYVLIVDDFEPTINEKTTDMLETVKDILSAIVQNSSCVVLLCVLPCQQQETQERKQEEQEQEEQEEQENKNHRRPQLNALQGLTLHTNGFSGWKNTTEILVYDLDTRVQEMIQQKEEEQNLQYQQANRPTSLRNTNETKSTTATTTILPPIATTSISISKSLVFDKKPIHVHKNTKIISPSASPSLSPSLSPLQSSSSSQISTIEPGSQSESESESESDVSDMEDVDINDNGYQQDDEERGLETVVEEDEEVELLSVPTTPQYAIVPATPEDNTTEEENPNNLKIKKIQNLQDIKTIAAVANMKLKKGRKWVAECIATFAINNTNLARRHRITLSKLAHDAQRERLDELRRHRIEDEEFKIKIEEEKQKKLDEEARQVAEEEARLAGLPALIARQKRIAWEKWLAGEQKREKRELKEMMVAEEESKLIWEEIRAIAIRKYKARQRELTQGRKRLSKIDKAVLKVLATNRKNYLKQQERMTEADLKLREIEAEEMKKTGKKPKRLLDGWVTKKRMIAETFAKLPFVCKAIDLFKRVDLAVYLEYAEKSHCDPQLDSNFGMVDCLQGSNIVTFTGQRPELKINGPLCIKDDLYTIVKYETKTVTNEDTSVTYTGTVTLGVYGEGKATWNNKPGSYKAQFLEEGKVERYRLIPEELRPLLLTLVMQPIDGNGRVW